MSGSTSPGSRLQLAIAPLELQGTASAEASSAAGLPSGEVSGGWDPFEIWLQRIEQPRRRRAASLIVRSIP
jgi:hypothetical protein